MSTTRVFSTLPGISEEERIENWAQQIGCNLLLYEIFMRLDSYGKPMRVKALTDGIFFSHRFEWKRSYVEERIRTLAYEDRILTTKKIQSWTYVGLTPVAKDLVARVKRLHKVQVPSPPIL
jgi:hypothetical protein